MWSFVLFLAAAFAVETQQYSPRGDFCRRFSHEAAVIGDRLYINNGQLNLAGKGGKNFTNDRLLWHDLTTTLLDGQNRDMPILMTNLSKPSEVPSVVGGTLWADETNGRLFQYGGEWVEPIVPEDIFRMWTYDAFSDSWSARDVNHAVRRLSFGASAAVEHLGMGYYMGGWMSELGDIDWVGPRKASNKLVEYDLVRDEWQNRTGPSDQMGRAEGALFYVPAGDTGMLVYFGGVRVRPEAKEEAAQMTSIDIYDMGAGKWYQQNSTGDIPSNRRRFCGGIVSAQDGSSHNIYIYGGRGFGANSMGFDDVHILSIPTFTWIKVYPEKGIVRKEQDEYPHYDMSCSVIKNSQLLIIGGQFPKDPDATNCDTPKSFGVHNLVMSKVDKGKDSVYWDVFDPTRDKYIVPQDIIEIIGGDSKGNAQAKSPNNGFDHADLDILFRRTIMPTLRTPTRTPVPGPSTSSPSTSSSSSGAFSTPQKRALILAPSLVGLAILLAIILLLLRRYRKYKLENEPDNPPPLYKITPDSVSNYHPPSSPFQLSHGGYEARAYSNHPVELPLPSQDQGIWPSPPTTLRGEAWVPAGHYPPPLPEGFGSPPQTAQLEMKERRELGSR